MDKAAIEERLAQAHVGRGHEIVLRQRELVAELERDGHHTTTARQLLAEFERTQAMHISDRDRLRIELQGAGQVPS